MKTEIKILMLEDDPFDAELNLRELQNAGLSMDCRKAVSQTEFLNQLESFRPDLVLSDYNLPGYDGLSALEAVRSRDAKIPFIFVSGAIGEERAIEAIRLGATDYVLKDNLTRLGHCVQRAAKDIRQETEKQAALNALKEQRRYLKSLFESISTGVLIIDPETHIIVDVNPHAAQMINAEKAQIIGRICHEFVCPSAEGECPVTDLNETIHVSKRTLITADKKQIPILKSVVRLERDGRTCLVETFSNISALSKAQEEIRVNEIRLEALLALSQMTGASEKEISDFALEEVVRLTGSRVGYLHFFNEDQETIDLFSWSKETLELCSAAKDSHYPLEKAGIWADSIRKRQPVIHNGYPHLTQKKGYPHGHFPITRHLSVPVFDDGKIVAVAGVGNKKAPYDDMDVKQMSLFMNSMWQIVKKRRAENELKQREAFLRTILENIPDMIFVKDAETFEYIGINRAGEKMLGYARNEVLGRTNQDIYTAADARAVSKIDCQVLETGRMVEVADQALKRKDGTTVYLHTKKIPVKDETGALRYLVGISEDITARKAEKQLQKLLRASIENAGESIVITDADTRIQYVNPTFERTTGYTRVELLGKQTRILKSGHHPSTFYADMWETLATGNTWRGIMENKKKNGSFFTEEATISPILDNGGTIVNYVAVKRDVTERIKMEKRVQHSQKLEAIGTLAGGIAHDFNNILFAIMGFTALALEDAQEGSDLKNNLSEVYKASLRARELVKQILSFSRQNETKFAPAMISPVLKEVIKLLRASLPSSIEIRTDIRSRARVCCDTTQIHQIIMNLCTNAFHAMESGGGTLEVKLSEEILDDKFFGNIDRGRFLMMSISDTGVGMTADVLEKVFEPYFTTKGVGRGTGLGLSVVHGIVKDHGGVVKVYSEPGMGTTFKVFLPVYKGEASMSENEIPERPARLGRILFVDDEKPLVKLGKRMLSSLGYHVIIKTSSREALALFKGDPSQFDLVITDLTMPEMTGDVLAGKVKRIRPDIPVILCSGYATPEMIREFDMSAISAIVHKPIMVNDMVKKINRVLVNSRDKTQ